MVPIFLALSLTNALTFLLTPCQYTLLHKNKTSTSSSNGSLTSFASIFNSSAIAKANFLVFPV